ncbi:MAG: aspartyl protease family protein [Sphingomonas sp.]|nr:aspartyl protease family protein [Sphingomonas sp.]
MAGMKYALLILSGGAMLMMAPPAPAQPPTLDALFAAAGRGDMAPIARALDEAADADERALLRARIAAARYESGMAADPVLRRLAQGEDLDRRRAALALLASVAFADGVYAEAARLGQVLEAELLAAGRDGAEGAGRMWRLAALLAGQPAQVVDGGVVAGAAPARVDRVGLPRIDFAVNGAAQEAVFDTGAALSVLSAATAERLGVRVLEDAAEVGNGVQGTVPVRVGVAERIEIAGTVIRNVPFLIIDDAQLTFPQVPGGYDIRAIVGLPVMRALGRLRMENAGRLTILPGDPPSDGVQNMHADGNDLYIDVTIDGRPVPLFLDTGANQTSLSALYAEAHPEIVAALETRDVRLASAGGARQSRVANWTDVPVGLAGRTLVLPDIPVTLPGDGPAGRHYGVLGSNLLRAFESYTLDFAAMRLELGAPVRNE